MPDNNSYSRITSPSEQYPFGRGLDPATNQLVPLSAPPRWDPGSNSWIVSTPQLSATRRLTTSLAGMPENLDVSLAGNRAALPTLADPETWGNALYQAGASLMPYGPSNLQAARTGWQRLLEPQGIGSRLGSLAEYLSAGVPWIGPGIVDAQEKARRGDIAGSVGSSVNLGLMSRGLPETAYRLGTGPFRQVAQFAANVPEADVNVVARREAADAAAKQQAFGKEQADYQQKVADTAQTNAQAMAQSRADYHQELADTAQTNAQALAQSRQEYGQQTTDIAQRNAQALAQSRADYHQQAADTAKANAQALSGSRESYRQQLEEIAKNNAEVARRTEAGQVADRQMEQASQLLPQLDRTVKLIGQQKYPILKGSTPKDTIYQDALESAALQQGTKTPTRAIQRVLDLTQPGAGDSKVVLTPDQLSVASVAHRLLQQNQTPSQVLEYINGAGYTGKKGDAILKFAMKTPPGSKIEPTKGLTNVAGTRGVVTTTETQAPTLPANDLHGLATELYEAAQSMPDDKADERAAILDLREKIMGHHGEIAASEGKAQEFNDAQKYYGDYLNVFRNTASSAKRGSAIARALQAREPLARLPRGVEGPQLAPGGPLRPEFARDILLSNDKEFNLSDKMLAGYPEASQVRAILRSAKDNYDLAGSPGKLQEEPTLAVLRPLTEEPSSAALRPLTEEPAVAALRPLTEEPGLATLRALKEQPVPLGPEPPPFLRPLPSSVDPLTGRRSQPVPGVFNPEAARAQILRERRPPTLTPGPFMKYGAYRTLLYLLSRPGFIQRYLTQNPYYPPLSSVPPWQR